MTYLELTDISKSFGNTKAVDHLSLRVPKGHCLILSGPSGSGKTTVLRIIAGLDTPDTGTVSLDGKVVTNREILVPPRDRRIGMVFQDLALWPHLRAGKQLDFVLKSLALTRNERGKRIDELLESLNLTDKLRAYPHEMSGGQQQRLAIARALAGQPDLLLLDEPFSNLDIGMRRHVLALLETHKKHNACTCVCATHDPEEIGAFGDTLTKLTAP